MHAVQSFSTLIHSYGNCIPKFNERSSMRGTPYALANAADTSQLYLPKPYGGLGLPAISLLFKKQQISQACQILTSHDPIVRHTATIRT